MKKYVLILQQKRTKYIKKNCNMFLNAQTNGPWLTFFLTIF